MASWILPKNERWDNFQYRKIPSIHFLEESRTPYFFSAFKVKHIFIRAYHTFHSKVNLISYAPDKNPTTGVMLLLARAQVGILHFNSEWPKNWLVQEKCSAKVFFVQFDWKKIIAGENSWLFIMHFLSLTHFHIIIFRRYRDLSYCEIYTQH